MNAKQALDSLVEIHEDMFTEDLHFTRMGEIIKALREADQWQPPENIPKDRCILAEVLTDDEIPYITVIEYDKEVMSLWVSESDYFTQDQIIRWKDIE